MRYVHPTPENMRLAVERLGEILDPTRQKVDSSFLSVSPIAPVPRPKFSN